MSEQKIKIEVAYALPKKQKILTLDVDKGCSARELSLIHI